MADSDQKRSRLPYWGCFVAVMVVLILAGNDIVLWLSYRGAGFGSPITVAAVGFIVAAFGIWLIVRLVNGAKKPSAELCICVVLVIAAGALSVCIPYFREHRFIQRIKGWGGNVETETAVPEWLRNFVGEDRMKASKVFERVTGIFLWSAKVTDADMAHLTGRNIQKLYIRNTGITDAGMAHLSRLMNLQELQLENTTLTDAGLGHLRVMKNLRFLVLDGTLVTEEGTSQLKKALPDCQILVVRSKITGARSSGPTPKRSASMPDAEAESN